MTTSPSPRNPYRTLGRSGAVVFEQALGTMTFGKEADEPTSHAIIDFYVAAGGNLIDTADIYCEGRSEEIIGRWLSAHPTDAAGMVLATKGRFPTGPGPNDVGNSRRHLRTALESSLRRLGVEHIDLYQLHAWDAITPLDETLRFLDDAIAAGKIGYYGFSNFTGWQLTKATMLAEQRGWTSPVTLQPQYSLLVRGIEHEIVPAALDAGIGLLPWSPLGGGWLTGKYLRDVRPEGATRLGERGVDAWEQQNEDPRTWRIVDAVAEVAEAHGATSSQVALAWLVAQPAVTSVILGARSVDQLRDNLGAVELELTSDELEKLTEVSAPEVDDYPYGKPGRAQRHRGLSR